MNSFPDSSQRVTGLRVERGTWLLLLALVLVAATAWQPSLPLTRIVHRHLLVFDITQSMNVADVGDPAAPLTRLDYARNAAIDALASLDCGSSIAVGLFTGHRTLLLFTPVEVCAHYGEIRRVIEGVDWRMAWEFRSEVAKGLHSAMEVAGALDPPASVLFLTDGHEAPPINVDLPPRYEQTVGTIRGALLGIGGPTPAPIPKLDPDGQPNGFFSAAEVLQTDPFRQGRATGIGGESMAGEEVGETAANTATEHLSALREAYLRALATGLELDYRRIEDAATLRDVMRTAAYGTAVDARVDLRWLFGLLAMLALAGMHVWPETRAAAAGPVRGRTPAGR